MGHYRSSTWNETSPSMLRSSSEMLISKETEQRGKFSLTVLFIKPDTSGILDMLLRPPQTLTTRKTEER